MDDLIKRLSLKYDVKIFDIKNEYDYLESGADYYDESSSYSWNEITIGIYKDDELKLISLFHELGHHVDVVNKTLPKYEDLPYYHFFEASAWKTGLRIAKEEGYTFSVSSLSWARLQLSTYFKDNSMEHSPLKHLTNAINYAFE